MEQKKKIMLMALYMMASNTRICSHAAPVEDSVINKDLNGIELIRMGKELKRPLLSLLGKVFVKVEQNISKQSDNSLKERESLKAEICNIFTCKEWTVWSPCSAETINEFGVMTRTRTCGGVRDSSICSMTQAERVETDNQICQGTKCEHTLTTNKYCIKLYNDIKVSQKDASERCHNDGGYLMNIDSEMKAKDIEEYFTNISYGNSAWIDGKRNLPNGDWKYIHYSKYKYSAWEPGEPDKTDDCKVIENKSEWWGRSCNDKYHFLCEIF